MSKTVSLGERKLGGKDKFGYMMGDFGCNMTFQLVTAWLMKFACDGCGLDFGLFAILIVVAKIFDAINDPIIGALVDARKPGKHGKYKPWIFWGGIAIAATTILLFVDISSFPTWAKFTWILLMYMLWSIAYTSANVPYGSLNASLTNDAGERASLSSLRSIGAGLALLPIMVFVPKLVLPADGSGANVALYTDRFIYIAIACGVIGIGGFLLTLFLTKEKPMELAVRKEKINYLKTLKNFFKNRSVVALSLASLVQLVFIMSYTLTIPYVYPYYFKDNGIVSIANIVVMVPMVAFIPFMGKLSTKYGKKEITARPNLIGIFAFAIMLVIQICGGFPRNSTGAWLYTILYMIGLIGGGTFMLATWSMVADCVDEQEVECGTREEASVYATYSFARKVAQGIGAGLVALLFGAVGCKTPEGSGLDGVAQDVVITNTSEPVANGIMYIAIILPLVGFILAFVLLAFMYNLNKKKVEYNTALLQVKRDKGAVNLEPAKLFYDAEETVVTPTGDSKTDDK